MLHMSSFHVHGLPFGGPGTQRGSVVLICEDAALGVAPWGREVAGEKGAWLIPKESCENISGLRINKEAEVPLQTPPGSPLSLTWDENGAALGRAGQAARCSHRRWHGLS